MQAEEEQKDQCQPKSTRRRGSGPTVSQQKRPLPDKKAPERQANKQSHKKMRADADKFHPAPHGNLLFLFHIHPSPFAPIAFPIRQSTFLLYPFSPRNALPAPHFAVTKKAEVNLCFSAAHADA